MKIEKISPQGYCGGVVNAINLTNKSIDYKHPIYMLGKVIHNDIVCKDFEDKGIIIKTNNKYDALNEINSGTIIFTAHGVDDKLISLAQNKKLNIIDTTCAKVRTIKNNIKKYINTTIVLYIGVLNHPECDAVLSISKDIILIKDIEDVMKLDKEKSYYVTNQTTLSLLKLKDIYDYINNNFTNAIVDNKICLATTRRQQAVLNCDADCIIVVGDYQSSNTNELFNIAKSKCDSYLINSYTDIININLEKYKNIKITSGASTPKFLVDELLEYLNKIYL